MGFYDEDEAFGEPEENASSCFSQPEPKRMRLNETLTWIGDRESSTPDQGNKSSPEDESEEERDSEEVAARHEILRRIGLRRKPSNALRRYLRKVANGTELNPWLSNVYAEKTLRKKLRRFVSAMVIKACKNEGVEESHLDASQEEAIKFVDRLNEELIESLSVLGNFSSDMMRCARSSCQKAFLLNDVANTLVSRVQGDYTHCQEAVGILLTRKGSQLKVPECPHTLATHDDVNYLIVEGGSYSDRLEMPNFMESPSKLLCLCSFHNGLFEFMFDIMHMKWNVYQNCLVHVKEVLKDKKFEESDEVIAELPSDVIRSLVHYYMARYFCLWVFGDTDLWNKNGCTLFQAMFGSDGPVV